MASMCLLLSREPGVFTSSAAILHRRSDAVKHGSGAHRVLACLASVARRLVRESRMRTLRPSTSLQRETSSRSGGALRVETPGHES
jgi:hypothetical protein